MILLSLPWGSLVVFFHEIPTPSSYGLNLLRFHLLIVNFAKHCPLHLILGFCILWNDPTPQKNLKFAKNSIYDLRKCVFFLKFLFLYCGFHFARDSSLLALFCVNHSKNVKNEVKNFHIGWDTLQKKNTSFLDECSTFIQS